MQSLLCTLGKVALNGIEDEHQQVVFSEKDFGSEVFNLGCQVGIITRERLRSKCGVKPSVTFLHKSFQDFCAGMYLAKLLDSNQSEFDTFLKKLYQIKDDESEIYLPSPNVLDFCCGIQRSMLDTLLKLTKRVFGQGSWLDISIHLSHIFESQLTYAELVSLFSHVDNLKLSVSYGDVPYLLYLLKLSESENRHEGFILTKLVHFHITMGYEQWLPSLFKFTPNLVTLDIKLGKSFKSITPSQLKELYHAISKLGEMKQLKLLNLNVFIQFDITYLLDILTKNKKIDLKGLFLQEFQFDNKVMANCLTNCSSLTHLCLTQHRLQPGLSIKDVIKAIPTLRKLESLDIVGYRIGGTVKYLKSVVPQLLRLSLHGCDFNDQNLRELFTFLNRAQKLKSLNLFGTTFSLLSVKYLVDCLHQIPSLEELYLMKTGLNDETVCVLAEGLKEMKSPLHKLYLYGNSYSQIGRAALAGLPVEDDIAYFNECASQIWRDML
ncbi:NLR family CARD domain-containing protein 4-like [Amphiura filiformis]|uniref:NLR family CARD domain-containing protein 4-like n=1 Tax=Amphiura filiformis TaxID=82378 RepID=UPI003B20FFAA